MIGIYSEQDVKKELAWKLNRRSTFGPSDQNPGLSLVDAQTGNHVAWVLDLKTFATFAYVKDAAIREGYEHAIE